MQHAISAVLIFRDMALLLLKLLKLDPRSFARRLLAVLTGTENADDWRPGPKRTERSYERPAVCFYELVGWFALISAFQFSLIFANLLSSVKYFLQKNDQVSSTALLRREAQSPLAASGKAHAPQSKLVRLGLASVLCTESPIIVRCTLAGCTRRHPDREVAEEEVVVVLAD